MNRKEKMKQLKNKGLSYGAIGKLFGVSRQRIHQLVKGYIVVKDRNKKLKYILKAVFERDNYTCQICNKKGTLIHHIDKNNLNNNLDNLVCLCNNCHLNLHRPNKRNRKGQFIK